MGSAVFLVLMGLVMVYSAASVSDYVNFGDSMHHMKRQLLFAAIGLVVLFVARAVDFRSLKSLAWPFFALCVAGLVTVALMGVGKWGATRWIDFGLFTVQPSEYAKLACVLVAALLLTQYSQRRITSKDLWGRLFVACGIVVALVMMQPDMGTTMAILITVYLVLLLGGVDARILGSVFGAGVAGALVLIFAASYRAERLMAFLDPWSDSQGAGYQTIQAMLAFGSGGIDGVGLGMSRQKFFYLPAAHTDFIFAIIGEELGLIGTLSIVVAFALFAYGGFRIAIKTKDHFGRLVAGGLTGMIVIQALMNMAAVTNLMPVTGITMPLVSYGGSSMVFTLMCTGIIMSVSSHGAHSAPVRRGPSLDKENGRADRHERRRNGRPHLSSIDGGRSAHKRRA